MKKVICLITGILMLMPMMGYALTVNDTNPSLEIYYSENECKGIVDQYDQSANQNADTGYYLTCMKVSCVNNKVQHTDLYGSAQNNIKCVNGNTNPGLESVGSRLYGDDEIKAGATCTSAFETFWATEKLHYNCAQNGDDGSTYVPTSNNNNNNNNNNTTTNPQTGIETYYLVLSSTVIILSLGLYIVNKQNLFKKI